MQQVGWLVLIEGRMSRGVSLWADFMLKCIGHLLLLGKVLDNHRSPPTYSPSYTSHTYHTLALDLYSLIVTAAQRHQQSTSASCALIIEGLGWHRVPPGLEARVQNFKPVRMQS